jgi:hypothetical protein
MTKRISWLLFGAFAGLLSGLLLDAVIPISPVYLRVVQLGLVVLGAAVAAFVHEGSRAVTGDREPAQSTDRRRTRPALR